MARLAELGRFVETAQKAARRARASRSGIVQDGKVVFAGGFGVRELGKPRSRRRRHALHDRLEHQGADDADAREAGRRGEADVGHAGRRACCRRSSSAMPTTTKQVLVKHLICACTGLPRQDLEWLLRVPGRHARQGAAPRSATMQPTSKFGELFQYSNPMAGGRRLHRRPRRSIPTLELGAAYDQAMQTQVFDPLGMKATTFDYAQALRGNHAGPHAPDIDGKPARAVMELNYAVIPLRPAGGAWSSVRDMLKLRVDGARRRAAAGRQALHREGAAARAARAAGRRSARTTTYGMGLMVDTELRRARGAPRRRHDRLPQRHDVAARARAWAPSS